MKDKKNNVKKRRYFDYSLLCILIFLVAFGLVMIYSTSSYSAALSYDDSSHFFKNQLKATCLGLVGMFVLSYIPVNIYKKFCWIIYAASVMIIFLVLTPLGYTANGATRWFSLFGFSVQPAEITKIGIIIFTAAVLSKMSLNERRSLKGLLYVVISSGIAALIIYKVTNNMSSAIIVFGIAFCVYVLATPKCYKAWILALSGLCIVVVIVIGIAKGWFTKLIGFRGERILAWLDLESYSDGVGFQTLQALYGIGSGGVFGKGLGKSIQKLGFLPEASNDMIFSIICEELGLFGGLAVLILFLLLLWRLRDISYYTKDVFSNLIVCGVFSHIAIQVVLNIAVVTNIFPNTGISLPFISYGGSSVVCLLAEMGFVMSVCRRMDFTDENDVVPQRAPEKISERADRGNKE